jgi:hypothetical protein
MSTTNREPRWNGSPTPQMNGPSPTTPGIADPFAAFANASAQIQGALQTERERARRLEEQLVDSRRRLAETLAEDRTRIQELSGAVATLRASNGQHVEHSRELEEKVRILNSRYQVQTDELQRYRAAWADVLQREREAKSALLKSVEQEKRSETLQSQVDQLSQVLAEEQQKRERSERFAEAYQAELKHALVRIHAAESKFSELSKEHQTLAQSKRNFQEEVAKVEAQIRERANWEVQRERERLRLEQDRLQSEHERARIEGERQLAEERERTRSELQRSLLEELESRVSQERKALVQERARREMLEEEVEALGARIRRAEDQVHRKVAQGVNVFTKLRSRKASALKEADASKLKLLNAVRDTYEARIAALEQQQATELARISASYETKLSEARNAFEDKERMSRNEADEKIRAKDGRLQALEAALDRESDRSDSLQEALHSIRGEYENALRELTLEITRARTLDPIRHLRTLKERELAEMRRKLDPKSGKSRELLALVESQIAHLSKSSAEYEERLRSLELQVVEASSRLEPMPRSGQTLDA